MPLKSLSLLSLLISSSVYAWDRGLASCDDVDCPPLKETGPAAGCNIVNRTYQIVGISNFSSQIAPEGQNLTWTVGVKARDGLGEEGHDRVVEKGFYLGTPPGLELKPYGNATLPFQGCAVILNTNKTTYPDRGSWACPDVIGEDCYSQLLDSMTEYVEDAPRNETTEQTCQELVQRAVSRGSACEDLLRDDTWSHMQAIPLTGPAAPSPPTESQNSSSTCHPTLPKSNDLTFVWAYNDTGTVRANTTIPMLRGINLAMTVFWSPDEGAEGALSEPDAHMSCLWPVDHEGQTSKTKVENEAGTLGFSWATALSVLMVGAMLA